MAYREVTMLEVKEVLRLWLAGVSKKRIAVQLGLNVKTVRRYVGAAWASGLAREAGPEALDEGLIAAVVSRVQPSLGRPHGDGWAECVAQRPVIERYLQQRVRLSKSHAAPTPGGARELRDPPALRDGRARLRRDRGHDSRGRLRCPFHLVDPGTLGPAAALGHGPSIRRTRSVDHLGSARSHRGVGFQAHRGARTDRRRQRSRDSPKTGAYAACRP